MEDFIARHQLSLAFWVLCLGVLCCGEAAESGAAPMEPAEQAALFSAIKGFVGNWWNGSELYPDPCGWTPIQGVSCDIYQGLWYVTGLSIGSIHENSLDCGHNVEFRPQLFELLHLKSLTFFNCFSSHKISIPSDNWEKLAGSLESLEFRSNPCLDGQVPETFASLTKLQSLVLLENGVAGKLPTSIGNLTRLKRLVLSRNGFSAEIPSSFGGLKELLIMDLSRNSLSGPIPLTFGGLSSLLKLDLSNNQLEGTLPLEIANLKSLTLLDLGNNKFSGALKQPILELNSLQELVLSNNQLGGDLMSLKWGNLQNLVILDISNVGLGGEIPESITGLKRLRFLGLNNNNLTGNIPQKLASLEAIGAVYLYGNNLTGELKFSEEFYGKMGRRFGAWDNPNLCFPVGLVAANHGPSGVKPCQKDATLLESNPGAKFDNGKLNYNSNLTASSGVSLNNNQRLRLVFLIMALILR